ncbi:MAG TPA: branched-chain amino acid ABC transporter permease [Burkholderiales bacterium]|jgi:branched-chain amino acid transport system permease protein|nr:branched-chain amino acid ABC transporter permease [Burkholderiales bacterium]
MDSRAAMLDPAVLAQILWTGLATSSYMVLFTIAFALVLKVLKLWNFAQAGMMAIAFYVMYAAVNHFNWPTAAAVALGFAATLAATLAYEVLGLRTLRARRSSSLLFFIFTLVCSEFTAYALTLIFGTEPVPLFPEILSPTRIVGSVAVSNWDLLAVCVTLVLGIALALYLRLSRDGQFLLAVSDSAELAELYGIDAKRAYVVALTIASVFACAGMYLYGSRTAVIPTAPLQLMLFAVIATLLGGMGSVVGAILAAVFLSLLQSYSVLIIPSQWQGLILYVFLFVTILFFPNGIHPGALLRRLGLA